MRAIPAGRRCTALTAVGALPWLREQKAAAPHRRAHAAAALLCQLILVRVGREVPAPAPHCQRRQRCLGRPGKRRASTEPGSAQRRSQAGQVASRPGVAVPPGQTSGRHFERDFPRLLPRWQALPPPKPGSSLGRWLTMLAGVRKPSPGLECGQKQLTGASVLHAAGSGALVRLGPACGI